MPACVLRCLASDLRRVYLYAVHLTYNDIERGKMPSPLKIGLYVRYHSERLAKYARIIPEQAERILRGLYHAITPERLDKKRTLSRQAVLTETAAHRISPNRSRQTGAACHGQPMPDFSQLSGQGSAAGSLLPYCHARKCFLRFFCADFCELRLMLISCNP